jgi:hypothetical protein
MAPAAPAGLASVAVAVAVLAAAASAAVTYDRKAVVVNGQRRILMSGSIHYPRSVPEVRAAFLLVFLLPSFLPSEHGVLLLSPEMRASWPSAGVGGVCLTPLVGCLPACLISSGAQMWPDLIQKAKDGGLDVVQTYVFWNGHEPSRRQVVTDAATLVKKMSVSFPPSSAVLDVVGGWLPVRSTTSRVGMIWCTSSSW